MRETSKPPMHRPNTTFDIYLGGALPPVAPDVEGATGHLSDHFARNRPRARLAPSGPPSSKSRSGRTSPMATAEGRPTRRDRLVSELREKIDAAEDDMEASKADELRKQRKKLRTLEKSLDEQIKEIATPEALSDFVPAELRGS
jgi:hypothetical protein